MPTTSYQLVHTSGFESCSCSGVIISKCQQQARSPDITPSFTAPTQTMSVVGDGDDDEIWHEHNDMSFRDAVHAVHE